jgi:hypothetical protein
MLFISIDPSCCMAGSQVSEWCKLLWGIWARGSEPTVSSHAIKFRGMGQWVRTFGCGTRHSISSSSRMCANFIQHLAWHSLQCRQNHFPKWFEVHTGTGDLFTYIALHYCKMINYYHLGQNHFAEPNLSFLFSNAILLETMKCLTLNCHSF